MLSNLGVARWLQSSWKLSRAFGVSNVAVLHRVSDLRSVGASDSEQVALAQGLLADSETRVVYAQSPGRARGRGRAAVPLGHRGGPAAPAAAGHRAVEGGTALVPGPAPPERARSAHRRYRRRHGGAVGGDRPGRGGAAAGARRRAARPGSRTRAARAGAAGRRRRAPRAPLGPRGATCARCRSAPAPPTGPAGSSATVPGCAAVRCRGRAGPVAGRHRPDPERQDDVPGRPGHPGLARPGGGRQRQERPAARHAGAARRARAGCGASIPTGCTGRAGRARGRRSPAARSGGGPAGWRPICARRPRPTARRPTASSGTPRRPSCWPRSSSPRRWTGAPWPTWCAGSTPRRSARSPTSWSACGVARGARCGPGHLVPRRAHAQLGLHHGRDGAGALRPCARRASAADLRAAPPARRPPHALPVRAGPRPAPAARLLHGADPAGARLRVRHSPRRSGRPLDPPLLVVLDEAAHIAPLPELDGLAATCASHGIQFVTVWQDLAQVRARYGLAGAHGAQQPPGQALPARDRRPRHARVRQPADRRRGGRPALGHPGPEGRPLHHLDDRAAPAASARGAPLPAAGAGPSWSTARCRRPGFGCARGGRGDRRGCRRSGGLGFLTIGGRLDPSSQASVVSPESG